MMFGTAGREWAWSRASRGLIAGALTAMGLALISVGSAQANPLGEITLTSVSPHQHAGGIVVGPEADLQFTAEGPEGNEFVQFNPTSRSVTLAVGLNLDPDRPLVVANDATWFIGDQPDIIGELTGLNTHPSLSEHFIEPQPESITVGHDGNLWYTELENDTISRYTPSTHSFTSFSLPPGTTARPAPIAPGPEGDVWFIAYEGTTTLFERITSEGTITAYPTALTVAQLPSSLAEGPDETLWFTQPGSNEIGQFSPTGGITEYPLSATPDSEPRDIVKGQEGDMWFAQPAGHDIGRIIPAGGSTTEYSIGAASTDTPRTVVLGPEHNIWFTVGPEQIGDIGTEGGEAPRITSQPANETVTAPTAASFRAACSGEPAPTFQWEVSIRGAGFTPIAGANSSELTVSPTSNPDNGDLYRLTCTNSEGKAVSRAASLTVKSASGPEFGRCENVGKGAGRYSSAACTRTGGADDYAWVPGVGGSSSFSTAIASGAVTLETVNRSKVTCTSETGTGTYISTQQVGGVTLTLTGCTHLGQQCTSSGQAAGEIAMPAMAGYLGIDTVGSSPSKDKIGLVLYPADERFEFECATTLVVGRGSVILPLSANKMLTTAKLKLSQSKGKQKPAGFAEESGLVLGLTFEAASPEQAGLALALKLTNEEPVEVNSVV